MTVARKFDGDTLIVATHNLGKLAELRVELAPLGITLKSAHDLDLPEPEETETTYIGNAILKAKAAALATGQICLADDSGLSVNALDGAPGIYSARWAEDETGHRDFGKVMKLIIDKMGDATDTAAEFVCSIALCWPDGHHEVVEGYAKGNIVWPLRGPEGFGYDPIFQPNGHDRTFGEMSAAEKAELSHRRDAIQKIVKKCFS